MNSTPLYCRRISGGIPDPHDCPAEHRPDRKLIGASALNRRRASIGVLFEENSRLAGILLAAAQFYLHVRVAISRIAMMELRRSWCRQRPGTTHDVLPGRIPSWRIATWG